MVSLADILPFLCRSEEKQCRFCQQHYPDWRESFSVDASAPMPSTVTFALVFEHQTHLIEVKPGSAAAEDMRRQVTALTGVDDDRLVTFNVRLPSSGRPSQPAAVQHATVLAGCLVHVGLHQP